MHYFGDCGHSLDSPSTPSPEEVINFIAFRSRVRLTMHED